MDATKLKSALEAVLLIADDSVFIEANDGTLYVGGINTANGIVVEDKSAQTTNNFHFVIPTVFAKQMLRILSKPVVKISFEGDIVSIECGRAKMRISCLLDNTISRQTIMSKMPEDGDTFKINGQSFNTAISKVKQNANDKNIGDPVMLGFHFAVKDSRAELFTTNGRALSLTKFPVAYNGEFVVVLNNKFEATAKLMCDSVTIKVSKSMLAFETKDTESGHTRYVVSALVAGEPKQYQRIMDTYKAASTSSAYFEKKELAAMLKNLDFFAEKEEKLRVSLTLGDDSACLKVKTGKGESEDYIEYSQPLKSDKKDLTILLHTDIILKAIGSITGDKVVLRFSESNKPIYLTDETVENVLTVFLNNNAK